MINVIRIGSTGKPLLTFIAVLSMILNLDLYSQIDSNGIFQNVVIKEVKEKIKVDGVLDEPFWNAHLFSCAPIKEFFVIIA